MTGDVKGGFIKSLSTRQHTTIQHCVHLHTAHTHTIAATREGSFRSNQGCGDGHTRTFSHTLCFVHNATGRANTMHSVAFSTNFNLSRRMCDSDNLPPNTTISVAILAADAVAVIAVLTVQRCRYARFAANGATILHHNCFPAQ